METIYITTLRSLAKQRGIYIGAAANHRALRTDYAYREMLAQQACLIFGAMLSFMAILFVGYIYAVKKGAFDWKT